MSILYRMWEAVQPARIKPQQAVGLMLLPLFNSYWTFPAHVEWCQWYNNLLVRRGLAGRIASRSMIRAGMISGLCGLACIVSAITLITLALNVVTHDVGAIFYHIALILILLGSAAYIIRFILVAVFLKRGCDAVETLTCALPKTVRVRGGEVCGP
ncbi:MAG: hypothetical protein LLG01_03125 [Planctomycetaceae bacterium]|nr:hypothetical protein [Planctomycetaceae bacterium]